MLPLPHWAAWKSPSLCRRTVRPMQRILIVEDEQRLAAIIADYLHVAGFVSHWLGDGRGVVSWVREERPDLIVLDLMLPGRDGMEICKDIRSFSTVPIIMVTA
jgi:two-component system, OmpR family, response regulator BaeR